MRPIMALLPIVVLAGCSHYTIPPQHVAGAQNAVATADQVGASNSPDGASRLAQAKEELAMAQRLDAKGEKRHADLMYLRAEADARVSVAAAKQDNLSSEAQRIQEQIRVLRQASQ